MHRTTPQFWKRFEQLPESVQRIATRNFRTLNKNPRHPSLHFKKVGKFWSVRTGRTHRALAVEDDGDFTWVWIGGHDEYERLIRE